MAARKSASKKKSSSSTTAKKKVGKVMHEYKHGQLKSGGRKKVARRKQAVAIGLSEARKAGAKIPKKGAAKKKSSAKKAATKKSAARKRS